MLETCSNDTTGVVVGALLSDTVYEALAPESRLAAIGLLLRILDQNNSAFSNCFVVCPDGTKVCYSDAVGILSDMLGKMISAERERLRPLCV